LAELEKQKELLERQLHQQRSLGYEPLKLVKRIDDIEATQKAIIAGLDAANKERVASIEKRNETIKRLNLELERKTAERNKLLTGFVHGDQFALMRLEREFDAEINGLRKRIADLESRK
jgi:hypothetical protein